MTLEDAIKTATSAFAYYAEGNYIVDKHGR